MSSSSSAEGQLFIFKLPQQKYKGLQRGKFFNKRLADLEAKRTGKNLGQRGFALANLKFSKQSAEASDLVGFRGFVAVFDPNSDRIWTLEEFDRSGIRSRPDFYYTVYRTPTTALQPRTPPNTFRGNILIGYNLKKSCANKIASKWNKRAIGINLKRFVASVKKPANSDYWAVYSTPSRKIGFKKGRKPKNYVGSIQEAQDVTLLELIETESQVSQRLKLENQFRAVLKAIQKNQSDLEMIFIRFRSSYARFLKNILINKDNLERIKRKPETEVNARYSLFIKGFNNYQSDLRFNRKNVKDISKQIKFEFLRKPFEDNKRYFEDIISNQKRFWVESFNLLIKATDDIIKFIPKNQKLSPFFIDKLKIWKSRLLKLTSDLIRAY